jgi:acetyl-CoA synthetase
MLKKGNTYAEVVDAFRWKVPRYYNIGVDVCDKWAGQRYRLALIFEDESGRVEKYTFWELTRLSNRLANALLAHGIQRGDRVGILLPQCPETAISHIATYKIGAVAIPLFTLFGPDALEYRLSNGEAKAVITDAANLEKVLEIKERLPKLGVIMVSKGEPREGVTDFWQAVEKGAPEFTPARTEADDPALIIYTSGLPAHPRGPSRPSGRPGPPAWGGVLPQLLSQEGRPVLDPGGLGLDRGAHRRAVAQLASRNTGPGLSRQEVRP